MVEVEQFPYIEGDPVLGAVSNLPCLPVALKFREMEETFLGLVDSGATINVLPYADGLRLGATWEQQTTSVRLTGIFASLEARGILLTATVGRFTPVSLAFAWVRSNDVRLILGQINFFMEFDVCLFRSRSVFEVRPKGSSQPPPAP
jgi:hypothetical protein